MTEKQYPPKIAAALHQVMTKCGYVQKKGRNDFHRYNYAGEGDLLEVLRPAMIEAGLILIPSGVSRSAVDEHGNTHVEVDYTLVHKDGDVWPDKVRAFGSGNDKNSKGGVGDKGTYKALTGANKYLLFKLFQIETGDDPENASHDVPPAARPLDTPRQQQQAVHEPIGMTPQQQALFEAAKTAITMADTAENLAAWGQSNGPKMEANLPPAEAKQIKTFFNARLIDLKKEAA